MTAEEAIVKVRIADLMAKRVITATPHTTVSHARGLMEKNRIHSIPIVGTENEPVGIVTSTDLAKRLKDDTPVSRIMSREVTLVPAYNDASVAARIMRKQKIHHVVVTHEKQVVGLISSFDLLKLVEGHSFVAKNTPRAPKRKKERA
jgi:CBS domain-containing protein